MESKTITSQKRSIYTGVSWHASTNKWLAQMLVKGKQEFLGYFDNEKKAAEAYDTKKRELRKEGVTWKIGFRVNFPTEDGEKKAKKRQRRKKKEKKGLGCNNCYACVTGGSHPCQTEGYDSGASSASDSGGSVITTLIPLSGGSNIKMVKSLMEPVSKEDNFANAKARELALENNLLEDALTGTGKNGRITSGDVKKVLAPPKKKEKEVEMAKYVDGLPKLVTDLAKLSFKVREKFPFGGKESHFQAAMESELQEDGYFVQHEVGEFYHYEKMNGEVIRLPHDIRSREDLLLPREKLIVELKALPKLAGKDHCQLLRYMEENRKNSDWGEKTIGLLINYGDNDVEVWYMFYKGSRPQRVRVMQKAIDPFTSFVDSFVC
jgi:GxxExxY protein